MAIGTSFCESFQKALSALETGLSGLEEYDFETHSEEAIKNSLKLQTPDRIFKIAEAMRRGISVSEREKITGFDKWFLEQIFLIALKRSSTISLYLIIVILSELSANCLALTI